MTAPVRPCLGCAAYDDHPRHVLMTPDGADLPMHMDCCVMARNCEVCKAQLAEAKGAKGDKLRAYLVNTGPEADKPGWTAPADDSREG